MSGVLETYRHPGGMLLPLPPGWGRTPDPRPGVVLVAAEPDPAPESGVTFRANLVVTVDDVPEDLDLDGWQAGTEQLFPRALSDYLVVDLERCDPSGVAAIRRLAHHRSEDDRSVTMQQWTVLLAGGRGWTPTASVETPAYAGLADLLADAAAGWLPPGHPRHEGPTP